MARRFRVTVNGETFEVEVEEVGAAPASGAKRTAAAKATPEPAAAATAATAAAPAGAAAPVSSVAPPAVRAPAARAAGVPDGAVLSPLPGVVRDIRVAPGQAVRAGQVVLIVEAMKMENEIVAPRDGVVKQVLVSKGDAVAANAPLFAMA